VVRVAQALAWSAIPLGSLTGAAAINLSGSVAGVYAVIDGLIAAIAIAIAHGDRYLAEAAGRGPVRRRWTFAWIRGRRARGRRAWARVPRRLACRGIRRRWPGNGRE
jgi:hypothetical protein